MGKRNGEERKDTGKKERWRTRGKKNEMVRGSEASYSRFEAEPLRSRGRTEQEEPGRNSPEVGGEPGQGCVTETTAESLWGE